MIIREKDYIAKTKKKYTIGSLIWLTVMFSVFALGYFLNNTRNNIFTVVAAVLVLPAAQYLTLLFGLWQYKDPDPKTSEQLALIEGQYSLFHSVLVPHRANILYFDHIFVTGSKIYCIIDNATDLSNTQRIFNQKIKAKGIPLEALEYVDQAKVKNMGNIFKKIRISVARENEENLNEYTQLIKQMMM